MSFAGRVVVVAGATGVVGSGAVRRFLDAGATVIGISRSEAKLDALRATLKIGPGERFVPVVGGFESDEAAAATAAKLGGRDLDHVVSAVGFVTTGPAPTETPLATFRKALDDGLLNNVAVARAFLPRLRNRADTSFTLVSGGLAHIPPPDPGLWMGTVKNAAVNGLTHALAAEMASTPVRVNTVCIHFGVAPPGGKKNQLGMNAERDTLALGPVFLGVARGTVRGQVICLNGWSDVARWS